MAYIILLLLGVAGGVICTFVILDAKRKALKEQEQRQAEKARELEEALESINARQQELKQSTTRFGAARAEFEARVVSYEELRAENAILKRDLQNIDVNLRKLQLDRELQHESQEKLDARSQELRSRYLKENVKWLGSSLTPNNFVNSKQRLQQVIERCREIGFKIPPEEENTLIADLKAEYEMLVRAAIEREEQARIKAQIREEELLKREVERELKQLERERAAIQAALDQALAEAKDQHSAEVEQLRARLAEAEAKTRAVSQAQLTKCGHIYVISNIGSFGDGVFKIGMTRRLEPKDRIRELGDASVPFPFDVHMMISCQDAPGLECKIHRALHKMRINRINPRKEFFKTDVEAICRIVMEHHGEIQYIADAEALEYRQSLSMSDEDQEFIESVYEGAEDESEAVTQDE